MITERDLAEKFTVVWRQHFPMLSSNLLRLINEAVEYQPGQSSNQGNLVQDEDSMRWDLVAEVGFRSAKYGLENNVTIEEILGDDGIIGLIYSDTARVIRKEKGEVADIKVREFGAINEIARKISRFVESQKKEFFNFNPQIPGYGIIPKLEADLAIDNTLYEVKTVNRNFRSSDLRQLLLYLGLDQISKKPRWEYGGLYNPRRGCFYKFKVDALSYRLSGGKAAKEAFTDLLEGFNRDIPLDSKF